MFCFSYLFFIINLPLPRDKQNRKFCMLRKFFNELIKLKHFPLLILLIQMLILLVRNGSCKRLSAQSKKRVDS